MKTENEITALVATIEKCREVTHCPAEVSLQEWLVRLVNIIELEEGKSRRISSHNLRLECSTMMTKAVSDVIAERQRQRENGRNDANDDGYINGVLALAGAAYAISGAGLNDVGTFRLRAKNLWPFPLKTFRPAGNADRRRDLVRGAAMIVAEIDKIDRSSVFRQEEK